MKYTRSRCALVEFSPSMPARLQVFSSRAVGPTTFLRLIAEQLKIHALPTCSGRIFAKHARGASGILKTRRRPGNFSATGCRAAVKYTPPRRPQRALSVFACVFAAMASSPWRRSRFLRPQQRRVAANWLKPLKFPGCAAPTRRIGQLR